MRAIFISYRRSDAEGQAGRLFDDLKQHFGVDAVFMDVAGVEAGRDFRKAIDDHVSSCGVLLAIIGKSWLTATNEQGARRLDDPRDYVHLETASALKRDIPVVPVLVQGASMPTAEQLPDSLKDLTYRNSVELTHARWKSDVEVLIKALEPIVKRIPQAPSGESSPRQSSWASSRKTAIAGVAVLVLLAGGYALFRGSKPNPPDGSGAPSAAQPATPTAQAEVPPKAIAEVKPDAAAKSNPEPQSDAQPKVSEPAKPKARLLSYRDWEGTWDLRWKFADHPWANQVMTMKADRFGVTADYELGVLEGRFEGASVSTVFGQITNTTGTGSTCASGKQTGSFQLTLSKDGQRMEGWWDVCSEGEKYPWEARKR